MESKESKALEAKIADAIKSNKPRIAFDPGGNMRRKLNWRKEL